MGYDDVARAINLMDDEAARDRIAAGDLTDLSELELSDDEQTLLRDAAGDFPDVEGFILVPSFQGIMDASPKLGQALDYAKMGSISDTIKVNGFMIKGM